MTSFPQKEYIQKHSSIINMKDRFFQAQLIGMVIFGSIITLVVGVSIWNEDRVENVSQEGISTPPIPVDRNSSPPEVTNVEPVRVQLEGRRVSPPADSVSRMERENMTSGSPAQPSITNGEDVDVDEYLAAADVPGLNFSEGLLIDPDTVSLFETMALFFGNLDPATLGLPDGVPFEQLQELTVEALSQGGIDAETLNMAMIKVLNEVVKAVLEHPELVNIIPDIQNLLDYNLDIFGEVERQITGIVTEELTALFEEVFTEALARLDISELVEIIKLGDLYPSILSATGLDLGIFSDNLPMNIDQLIDLTLNPDDITGPISTIIEGIGDIDLSILESLSLEQLIGAIDISGLLSLNMSMVDNIDPGLITSCGEKHDLDWPFRPKWRSGVFTCSMCERQCRTIPYRSLALPGNEQFSFLWDAGSQRCGCG